MCVYLYDIATIRTHVRSLHMYIYTHIHTYTSRNEPSGRKRVSIMGETEDNRQVAAPDK